MEQKNISPVRYPALQSKDFRLFWLAQFVSNSGNQMQIVAVNWQVYLLTNSPIALGMIGLLRFLPIVIFSLIGGSFADSHNRKSIMAISQTILGTLSLILATTTFTNTITPTLIFIITFIASIAMSFDMPARQSFVPNLVDRKHLPNAMSLYAIMFQTASIAGPSLAGILIAKFDVGGIYVIDAASFAIVLTSLFFIKTPGDLHVGKTQVSLTAVKEGLQFVKSKPLIWSTMLLDFFSTFFSSATALLPIFAKDILRVGPQGLGLLYAAPSIGAVIAGFIMAHLGTIRRQGYMLLLAVSFYGLATALFGVSRIFWLSIVALMLVGAGDSVSVIIRNTIRQLSTPDYIRGRMVSVNMIFFLGGPQLGEFEAGMLAALMGAQMSVVTGG
ncbi:MAG: MFS transporter, partial [Candidatus Levybacteria bacterium]|nr:MFS transporter [Candidatus Levybacteria bacterium]